ncbi:transcriptional regulator [Sporanaerobium hydrogeniformans]|uniref:Transcriptional regulator n=1 Tax=Sporanaerobium hydrogeniformans TaxID=3072179 RepID=A0AC61DCE0_9FIRM|nr:metalloregulator ArsR/SmtB family transcription factor [Sporanaerobium hydrogeniformans]PHV70565.1 transcriptional regulator [Sporanaerobium hydrogeniformans]
MVELLKALADETRLRILAQVLKGKLCVCEIENCLVLTQSNVSRHLTILKSAGILSSYKKAQWTYYMINDDFINNHKYLYDYLCQEVKRLPSYQMDSINLQKSKFQDLCQCKK